MISNKEILNTGIKFKNIANNAPMTTTLKSPDVKGFILKLISMNRSLIVL